MLCHKRIDRTRPFSLRLASLGVGFWIKTENEIGDYFQCELEPVRTFGTNISLFATDSRYEIEAIRTLGTNLRFASLAALHLSKKRNVLLAHIHTTWWCENGGIIGMGALWNTAKEDWTRFSRYTERSWTHEHSCFVVEPYRNSRQNIVWGYFAWGDRQREGCRFARNCCHQVFVEMCSNGVLHRTNCLLKMVWSEKETQQIREHNCWFGTYNWIGMSSTSMEGTL